MTAQMQAMALSKDGIYDCIFTVHPEGIIQG